MALATYKASQASVRSLEAAEAAAEAEKLATEAASLAARAGTAIALNNALATAQAFNGVRTLSEPCCLYLHLPTHPSKVLTPAVPILLLLKDSNQAASLAGSHADRRILPNCLRRSCCCGGPTASVRIETVAA